MSTFSENIRKIYFYAVSLISLLMIIIAGVSLINLALRSWVFTKADSTSNYAYVCPAIAPSTSDAKPLPCDTSAQAQQAHDQMVSQRESTAAQDVALLLIGIPVFLYHWKKVNKEV
jgi:hypothetical protein